MDRTKRPIALIVDPSLFSEHGHHLGMVERCQAELAELQFRTVSLVASYVPADLSRKADLVPTFDQSIYTRSLWTWEEFEERARTFAIDLTAKVLDLRLRADVMILPGADQVAVAGLAQYLTSNKERRPPVILLWLMLSPHYHQYQKSIMAEYKWAFDALRKVIGDDLRIRVYCETKAMADAYEPYIGLKIEPLLFHKLELVRGRRRRRARRPGDSVHIVTSGHVNAAKGYHLLPEVIEQLGRIRDDLRFLIHGTTEASNYPGAEEVMRRLATLAGVTVRTNVLSAEDYLAWLQQGDLALLAYDPCVYKIRASGIFAEVTQMGIPAVVPQGCDFAASAIEEGRAAGIETFDAQGVTTAVLLALDRLDELASRAEIYAASHEGDALTDVLAETALAAKQRLPKSPRR